MGIRRKIMLGFISLGSLLFLSGVISIFELSKLSQTTKTILDNSVTTIELSKEMLDAVQEQNTALLQIVTLHANTDSILYTARDAFSRALNKADSLISTKQEVEFIKRSNLNYNDVVNKVLIQGSDSTNMLWFTTIYKSSYYDLTYAIKNFMVSTQHNMDKNTNQIKSNAYRAIMPGIIALSAAIIIIIVFFALIDLYYLKPILKINKGLRNYVNAKIPYKVTIEGDDEVSTINTDVTEIINMLRNKKS